MSIHIANPEEFNKKKQDFLMDGIKNLHIISDFDKTLTKATVDEKNASSSHGQIRKGGYLGPEYASKAFALFDTYYPIERNPAISSEIRSQKMEEWWTKSLDLLIAHGMKKDIIKTIIATQGMQPRDGFLQLLENSKEKNIPFLIFSAGLGDLIQEYLDVNNKSYNNIHVVSNFFDYNEDGTVKGYKSTIIHSSNKNEILVRNTPYVNEIKTRKNVILLGDTLGDVEMADGIEHNTIIKIGFLNGMNEDLKSFSKAYDVVILEDGNLDYVNNLIEEISTNSIL